MKEYLLKKYADYTVNTEDLKINIFPLDLLDAFTPGAFTQIVGEANSGKTTMALQIALSYCSLGKTVLYIDADNSVTNNKLKTIGLSSYDGTYFNLFKINNFESLEEVIDGFIEESVSLVIIDSLPNLINSGYLNLKHKGAKKGISITNNNSNYDSRPLNLLFKKYKALANQTKTTFLIINSFRTKIVMPIGTILKRYGPKCTDQDCTTILEICNIPAKHKYVDFKAMCSKLPGVCLGLKVIKSINSATEIIIPAFLEYGKGIVNECYIAYYLMKKKDSISPLTVAEFNNIKGKNVAIPFEELAAFYRKDGKNENY